MRLSLHCISWGHVWPCLVMFRQPSSVSVHLNIFLAAVSLLFSAMSLCFIFTLYWCSIFLVAHFLFVSLIFYSYILQSHGILYTTFGFFYFPGGHRFLFLDLQTLSGGSRWASGQYSHLPTLKPGFKPLTFACGMRFDNLTCRGFLFGFSSLTIIMQSLRLKIWDVSPINKIDIARRIET